MKHLTQWILALLALAAVANFSGAWTSVQEPPKQEKPAKPKMDKPPAKKLQNKNRQARMAALRTVMPTLKTSLAEAIQLAQTETKGQAYSAGVEITEGKTSIQVDLFVNDKFTVANVDPETKKVTVVQKKAEENGEEGEGEDGEDEKH
jgi:hypothetical protein